MQVQQSHCQKTNHVRRKGNTSSSSSCLHASGSLNRKRKLRQGCFHRELPHSAWWTTKKPSLLCHYCCLEHWWYAAVVNPRDAPCYTGNREEELSVFPWQGSTPLSPCGNPSPEKAITCQSQDGTTAVPVGVVSHTPCPQASMTQKKKPQKRYFCIEDATTDLTFTNLPNPLLKVSNA